MFGKDPFVWLMKQVEAETNCIFMKPGERQGSPVHLQEGLTI